jgi:adenylate cyclase
MTTGREPAEIRDAFEQVILGEQPQLTSKDVARAAAVSDEVAGRLWRALGFPDARGEKAFTKGDTRALTRVGLAVENGRLDLDTIVRMTRAVGQLISRLADWEVATFTAAMEDGDRSPEGSAERLAASLQLVEEIGPHFEELLVYAWRRHLAAAVGRIELPGADDDVSLATVGFADLVSFTALTNELDDDQIGDLVEVFEGRCQDVVADHRGRVIKTLGDSVLFVADSPAEGIDMALDIIAVIGGDSRLPDVRLGLATGPVVLRLGDVYGPAVNLASRLTGVARRNRVIIDDRTAGLLPRDEFETRVLPARPLRGFGDVEPVSVRRTRSRHDF